MSLRLVGSSPTLRSCLALSTIFAAACASGGASKETVSPVKALPPDAAPPPPPSDGLPAGFTLAFNTADARARSIVYALECNATVVRLRATGTFGAVASAPKAVYCERTADGVPIGGVYDIDSAFTRARRLTLIRLDGARPKYTDAVDTAHIAAEAKLLRDITKDVATGWKMLKRPFTVVAIRPTDGPVEGWVMPQPTKVRNVVTGGEIGMIRSDAGGLTRLVDHLGTWKLVPVPATGTVSLESAEKDVAAVADLVAARTLADGGRQVTVATATMRSALVRERDPATGSPFTWQHVPK